jgi:hypothetical protein
VYSDPVPIQEVAPVEAPTIEEVAPVELAGTMEDVLPIETVAPEEEASPVEDPIVSLIVRIRTESSGRYPKFHSRTRTQSRGCVSTCSDSILRFYIDSILRPADSHLGAWLGARARIGGQYSRNRKS